MTQVLVDPGICGFGISLEAVISGGVVKLYINSQCGDVRKLADILTEVSLTDLGERFTRNKIYKNADKCIRHPSCPVVCAIIKAVEAELGLALKKNVAINFV